MGRKKLIVEGTSLADYQSMLDSHDWYYNYSDDPGVWKRGFDRQRELERISKESPEHEKMWNDNKLKVNEANRTTVEFGEYVGVNEGSRTYWTLAVKELGGKWTPQFGDYDRAVVQQELEDTKDDWSKGSQFKIIKSGGGRKEIDAAVASMNEGTINEMKMSSDDYESLKRDIYTIVDKTGAKPKSVADVWKLAWIVWQNRQYDDNHPGFRDGHWERLLPFIDRKAGVNKFYDAGMNDDHIATAIRRIWKTFEGAKLRESETIMKVDVLRSLVEGDDPTAFIKEIDGRLTAKFDRTLDERRKVVAGPLVGGNSKSLAEAFSDDDVRELMLFADNDGDLYRQSYTPLMQNLIKKKEKGVYEPEKAVTLWKYHADRAAKKYVKDVAYGKMSQFSPDTRREAARRWEERTRDYKTVDESVKRNPAREALTRAVNKSIADGNPVFVNNIEWGFDLTSFTPTNWEKFLSQTGLKYYGRTADGNFEWRAGDSLKLVTGNNPTTGEYWKPNRRENEPGYASYMGFTGTDDAVRVAVEAVKKLADYKGESPNKREFI